MKFFSDLSLKMKFFVIMAVLMTAMSAALSLLFFYQKYSVPKIYIVALCIIFIALTFWGVLYVYEHYIIRPINRLTVAMDKIGSGNFNLSVGVNSADEIGWLGRSLQEMARNLEIITASREASSTGAIERRVLHASDLKYRQILDSITDMVLVKGPQSKILWANKAFCDFYGMSVEQLKGIVDSPVNKPDYTQQYIKDDAYVFSQGRVLDIPEEPVTRHDGEVRIFHTVKYPIFDEHGRVIMSVGVSTMISPK
jgi:PAS domain S-box-containing protein